MIWTQYTIIIDGFMLLPSKALPSLPYSNSKTQQDKTSTTTSTSTSTSTTLNLSEVDLSSIPAASEDARRLFFLWFFGGSGGGGIALAAFPNMYSRFQEMRSLLDEGPTLGGETIGLSPLCGYPRDISRADLEKVLSNEMSVKTMVEQGPKDNYWAGLGYLRFEAFAAANEDCNPLTVRVVFDSLTTNPSTAEPGPSQVLLDEFRTDVEAFKSTLLKKKATGWSAIGVLFLLLGITANVCGEAFAKGWFPDWPGNTNFPLGLVDPGFWTIPDYWI